jgi:hypothetical protein
LRVLDATTCGGITVNLETGESNSPLGIVDALTVPFSALFSRRV